MRVFNGTNSDMSLPFNGTQRLNIGAHSVSGDILPSSEFITTIITSYGTDEIALIITGQYELNLCANIPTSTCYVVQSLDEAISRFTPKEEKDEKESECENCCCKKTEEEKEDEQPVATPTPKKRRTTKKQN